MGKGGSGCMTGKGDHNCSMGRGGSAEGCGMGMHKSAKMGCGHTDRSQCSDECVKKCEEVKVIEKVIEKK
jgi:hypothetical protein